MTYITNGTIEVDEKVYPVLHLEIEEGTDSDPIFLMFTWEAVNQTAKTLTIKIKFVTPIHVSSTIPSDTLKITIRDPFLFATQDGLLVKKEDRVLRRALPPQREGSPQALYVVAKIVQSVIVTTLVVQMIFEEELNRFLNMVRIM